MNLSNFRMLLLSFFDQYLGLQHPTHQISIGLIEIFSEDKRSNAIANVISNDSM